jgi:hypothetical protein
MSREHHAGCIPSRIMSPWLSSAFGNLTEHHEATDDLNHPNIRERHP